MGHKLDWIEKLRLWLIPKLGVIAQHLSEKSDKPIYVSYDLHNREFVGRVPMNEESFEKKLDEMGFERNPIAALKTLESTGELEEGSWRKVYPEEHPDWQLHVILYDGEKQHNAGDTGYTYVYAHWELRWDTKPWKHYRGVKYNPDKGVKKMKKLLNENGIDHKPIRP